MRFLAFFIFLLLSNLNLLTVRADSLSDGDSIYHKKVLLINSYHPQYKWTDELTRGVIKELKGYIADENLHIEYLDGRRMLGDSIYSPRLYNFFQTKYHSFVPDVIVVSDDIALNFMFKFHKTLFKDIPVVFGGINIFKPDSLTNHPLFTGVLEGMDIQGNLDLILEVQPEVRRIIMIGDRTGLGLDMGERALEIMQSWKNDKVSLELMNNFSLRELEQKMASSSSDVAFLMLAIHKDNEGNYFSFEKDLEGLSKVSTVPIYGMWGALLIGNGVLGGQMNDPFLHGREIASIAREILEGVDVRTIPVKPKTRYSPQFDYNQMMRFDISRSVLPGGSKIYFEPEGFYTRYKLQVNIGLGILVFLFITTLILAESYRRQRQLNLELKTLANGLTKRNEELRQFSYVTSHDLRSPVVNLEGLISIFQPETKLSEENQWVWNNIKTTTVRLKTTIDDIVNITSLDSRQGEHIEQVFFEENFKSVLKDLYFLKKDKNVEITTDFEAAPGIRYIKSHIISVLEKLLSNALKFSSDDRLLKVSVTTAKTNEGVILSVHDNGLGIDLKRYKDRMFRLFERFNKDIEGKGMGLYIVKTLVEKNGGFVEVNSEKGAGSTFTVFLKEMK